MSKISVARPGCVNTISPLRILIMVMAFFVVLFIFFAGPRPIRRELAYRLKCNTCLKSLGVVFKLYADESDGNIPSIESWCDALGKYTLPGMLICASSDTKEDQSSYAMNEFLAGKKLAELPPDLVLLFESKPGWNKAGGPEILMMENHEGEGCNVLFVDGRVEFIKVDKVSELRWTISESNSDE